MGRTHQIGSQTVMRFRVMRCKTAELAHRNPRIPTGEEQNDSRLQECQCFSHGHSKPKTISHANKRNGEESMPPKRSRKTSKRTVVEPNKGDRGDNKCGGSVVERIVRKLTGGLVARTPDNQTSRSNYPKMLEPDYCKARLLEIGVGRRFWQSSLSPENARTFYVRVIQPLRRLQRRGVVETLQEITATDDRTPIAVEIIGQVDLTKVSKQQ